MKTNNFWTPQQDQMLYTLVQSDNSHRAWSLIAQKMNSLFHTKIRFGKQCRDRFINHLRLDTGQKGPNLWTRPQTEYLFSAYREMGSKWTQISGKLPGKTQNCVKNKFYGSLRKTVRNLNMLYRSAYNKTKKQIKFKSIMRIFEYAQGRYRHQDTLLQCSQQLRDRLLSQTLKQQLEITIDQVVDLMNSINQFSIAIRSFKTLKKTPKNPHTPVARNLQPQTHMRSQTKQKNQQYSESGHQVTQQSLQLSGSIMKQNKSLNLNLKENQQILLGKGEQQNRENYEGNGQNLELNLNLRMEEIVKMELYCVKNEVKEEAQDFFEAFYSPLGMQQFF